jgi:hypothetical protein
LEGWGDDKNPDEEEEEEDVIDDNEDEVKNEEIEIDLQIMGKHPEFKRAANILEGLKKKFP